MDKPFSIFPLGDSAMTLDLGHLIDEQLNRRVLAIEGWLRARSFPGLRDIIVAYGSVTVFYDPIETGKRQPAYTEGIYKYIYGLLEEAWMATMAMDLDDLTPEEGALVRMPVCYGGIYGPDLEALSEARGLTVEEVIRLHTSSVYRVYMIGFLPGFPYLGRVDPLLEMGRKERPVPVLAGGVGIAGNQTGIYPVNSPGGWQIIGRTPVKLFDPGREPPVKLAIGDRVQFYPICPEEFRTS